MKIMNVILDVNKIIKFINDIKKLSLNILR